MELPFKCNKCNREFVEIDEFVVHCPKCKSTNVTVMWGHFATK